MSTGGAALAEDCLRLPAAARTLAGFRGWACSTEFPERGRVDYLAGDVEVDMSPEDLYTHGAVKAALAATLHRLVAEEERGYVFIDRARVSSPPAGLSAEPDVVVVLFESLDGGRVREVPAAGKGPGRFIELEGAPDVIAEIVSDSSQDKDLRRLPRLYARAGVRELWTVDARGEQVRFTISTLAASAYEEVAATAEGWTPSPTLGGSFRLLRHPTHGGRQAYRLEHAGL